MRKVVNLFPFPVVDKKVLKQELQALKKLHVGQRHKNLVEVLEYREQANGTGYVIDMEFCELTLYEYIYSPERTPLVLQDSSPYSKSNPTANGIGTICNIILQIADGLAFIHKHKEVHRNLKPSNGIDPS